ncbi:MAG: HD domain-containing protein [bacterium]|nr:HD domain-containing protein [bacterium]
MIVGGWVRDALVDRCSSDIDLEVFGLGRERVTELVRPLGFSGPVGRQFPVWRHTRSAVDLAFPRAGQDFFEVDRRETLSTALREAARHRDLTINTIAWDPLGDRLYDPLAGIADLDRGVLRAADPETFGVDPLRVLRVARLSASLEARIDEGLVGLCRGLDLRSLPVERVAAELRRILMELERPSRAFEALRRLGHLSVFAPLASLEGVPQDPRWHPEGDVFVHTLSVVDRAAQIAASLSPEVAEPLLFAALCHDLGKPETTTIEADRIRSLGHEAVSAERVVEWLGELRFNARLVASVEGLVRHHLAPSQFVEQGAGLPAYRRLARKLAVGGSTLIDLERVARADHLGRGNDESSDGTFGVGVAFLERADQASAREGVRADVVSASFAMRRGIAAGPELGRVLVRCRAVQDETGWDDDERILETALADLASEDGAAD